MHESIGPDLASPLASSEPDAFGSRTLRRFVASARLSAAPTGNIDRLPDGTTTLIFRLHDVDRADLTVLGPQSRATYKRGRALLVAKVVFQPGGAYPFFGVPLDVLADRVVPARDLWGRRADALIEELVAIGPSLDSSHRRSRWNAIERALLDRLHGPDMFEPAAARLARAAVRNLAVPGVTVGEVADTLGISGRSLRRAFTATVGISPKRFARIVRFQRVAAIASVSRGSWPEIALASGYSDQSHLIADFRELAGLSPAAFMKRQAGTSHRERDVPR